MPGGWDHGNQRDPLGKCGNLRSGGMTPITVVGVLVSRSTAPHDAGVLFYPDGLTDDPGSCCPYRGSQR